MCTHTYTHVGMYIYIYTHVYIYICIHIHISPPSQSNSRYPATLTFLHADPTYLMAYPLSSAQVPAESKCFF